MEKGTDCGVTCQQVMYLQIMLGLKIVSMSHFHGINTDLAPGTMLLPVG